jgi:hypothetical protein
VTESTKNLISALNTMQKRKQWIMESSERERERERGVRKSDA